MSKIGRNDPCPCGSGKKYKKCCIPKYDNTEDEYAFSEGFIKRNSDRGSKLIANYGEKMSQVIIDFAEPLLDLIPEKKIAYPLAVTAWNISLLPEEEKEPAIEKIITSFPDFDDEFREDLEALIRILIIKKHKEYPENKRFIVDYEFIRTGDEGRFNVMSTVIKD